MRIAYCTRVFLMFNNGLTATINDDATWSITNIESSTLLLSIHLKVLCLFTNRFWWHFKWDIHSYYMLKLPEYYRSMPQITTHTNLWIEWWLWMAESITMHRINVLISEWKVEAAFQFECILSQLNTQLFGLFV